MCGQEQGKGRKSLATHGFSFSLLPLARPGNIPAGADDADALGALQLGHGRGAAKLKLALHADGVAAGTCARGGKEKKRVSGRRECV